MNHYDPCNRVMKNILKLDKYANTKLQSSNRYTTESK